MKTIANTVGILVLFTFLGAYAVHAHVDVGAGDDDREAIENVRLQLQEAMQWATLDLTQTHPSTSFETDELELEGDWAIERGTYWQGDGKRIWVYQRQDDDSWKIKYIMWSSNSRAQ